jgi:hypothetical protein
MGKNSKMRERERKKERKKEREEERKRKGKREGERIGRLCLTPQNDKNNVEKKNNNHPPR